MEGVLLADYLFFITELLNAFTTGKPFWGQNYLKLL